jgi:hypothetical protein
MRSRLVDIPVTLIRKLPQSYLVRKAGAAEFDAAEVQVPKSCCEIYPGTEFDTLTLPRDVAENKGLWP